MTMMGIRRNETNQVEEVSEPSTQNWAGKAMPIAGLAFLVAEDHETQRSILVRILKDLGAKHIHEAADGHGALSVIADPTRSVDIVISDLDMPGMDGMQFIRELGKVGARISIILASALERKLLGSVALMTEAYGIRLLGVIEKPLTPDKLMPLIVLHQPAQAQPDRLTSPRFTLQEIVAGLHNDEFEPFLQPKIALATGQVKGAEALARWRNPRHGIVAPYAFIKPLEDNGLIDKLTWVMLRKAAALCSGWRAAGMDMTVSVNLSLKSLGDLHLADLVTEQVRSQNLEPRHIILEVTESAATIDIGETLENLARLRMKGFGLSIDDYGTGYSSMQQLMRIAFTELKIDQSFVMNAAKESSGRIILESSLDMAHKLNITSVAEGVETQADWDLLRRLGCDLAQGYFIARPMGHAAYHEWVLNWNRLASLS
jgi:EAL domain-containing protein (putative c-di-GMP-specific phosphodiesterase class I)/AmiR/NasT family two-component response regulator